MYLGSHLVAEVQVNGNTTQTLAVHTDALGTPIAQTDVSQVIVGSSTFLPYGGLYASSGVGNQVGPGYADQYVDDTGLLCMRARYYDPELRRFISADPQLPSAITGLNFNRYAYANNSPYRYYDPSGRYFCEGTDDDCSAVAEATSRLSDAASNSSLSDSQRDSLKSVYDFYGAPSEDNGVTIKLGESGSLPGSFGGTETKDGQTSIGIRAENIADGSDGNSGQLFKDRLAACVGARR